VERILGERTIKMKIRNTPETRKSVGKPRKRWLGDAENNLKKMRVRGCRQINKDRDAWKLTLKETRVLHGP
jgi:hypothetical protein